MSGLKKEQLLITDAALPWEDLGAGVKRKIMAHDGQLMLVKVMFEKGAVGALHHHPHVQLSYVASGAFEMTIDGHTELLYAGDVYYVPPNLVHGALCKEPGVLIDIFHPEREDFLTAG